MHQAAKKIVEQHGGLFPTESAEVFALPGIGRYTGGAILSIACQQPLPILEGNTVRVFSRVSGFADRCESKAGVETLWEIATALVPPKQPGKFNQAAMELGALYVSRRTRPAICARFASNAMRINGVCRARFQVVLREWNMSQSESLRY